MKLKSDPTLLATVREFGKFDTNACLQCGSCTVVCDLSNNSASFPRKTFGYTLIGLRSLLKGSLEPWLCYFCGDCSTTCLRETEPGESMMTLRRYLTAQYDWTGLSSKIYISKIWEIGSLIMVGILVLLLVVYYHLNIAELELNIFVSEPMGMEHMFNLIGTFTTIVFLIPIVFLTLNALRMYWFTMRSGNKLKIPIVVYFTEAKTLFLQAVTQKRFRDCDVRNRWIKHLILASGCGLIVCIKFFFLEWFQTDNIYPVYHPQRWLGYFAAGALIYTTVEILISRIRKREEMHKFSSASDWILPIMLLLTAVSGLAVHVFRYLEFELTTHFMYAAHLAIAVPMLVIEIPFGKWSHMIYRPLAIYLQAVKDKAI